MSLFSLKNLKSSKQADKPQAPNISKGQQAEALAEKYLTRNGLKIICQNFSFKGGEIDRIMLHHNTLVFIEVRLREHKQVSAAESVNIHKQRRLIKAAKLFLLNNPKYQDFSCRFDVVAFDKLDQNRLDWIQDAFQVQEPN